MNIQSLKSVDGVPFGTSPSALTSQRKPLRESINRSGELEVDFGDIVYRFAEEKLVEATFALPESLVINDEIVSGASLISFLSQKDPAFAERHGFAIAPNLGIAVDLDDENKHWTSVFVKGRWDD